MKKPKSPEPPNAELEVAPEKELYGLIARGTVVRRRRRLVGEDHTEVVTYTLGPHPIEFDVWRPTSYFQVGEVIEEQVLARSYNGQVQFQLYDPTREF